MRYAGTTKGATSVQPRPCRVPHPNSSLATSPVPRIPLLHPASGRNSASRTHLAPPHSTSITLRSIFSNSSLRLVLISPTTPTVGVSSPPHLDLVQHVPHADPSHPPSPVLHGDRIVLARLAVRIDHQIAELAIRSHALRVRVADERHDRSVQRNA